MLTPAQFEEEVRRIARYRWPTSAPSGSQIFEGRERDGIYITEDCVHLLECTCLPLKSKAENDLSKLFEAYKAHRRMHPDKAVKCWFITKGDPTAHQMECRKEVKGAPENLFNMMSFAQFQSQLVDSRQYIHLRMTHKFGSIYDPRTGSTSAEVQYIETGLKVEGELASQTANDIATRCLAGERFVLLGEYGAGKSMTLREVFFLLVGMHLRNASPLFPVYLNLREHQGQHEPAEILERHARNIGFPSPSQLVRAWKAGYIVLLLDGFDEVSSQGLQGAWRRLRDARSASMAGLKRLIQDSSPSVGMAVAGREHFFDTDEERKKALGQTSAFKDIRLDEFSEQHIAALVSQFGFAGEIPSWVPSRPLLLSTLFARGLSSNAARDLSAVHDPAAGWNLLLDEVCSREARIESGVSGENVRAILEALSTLARLKEGGLGPIATDDIVSAFHAECGFAPTDEALIVLQRLPGLGRDSAGPDDSRAFVDAEFADACRAGDFVNYCRNPYGSESSTRLSNAICVIGQTGISLAAYQLERSGFNQGLFNAAVHALNRVNISTSNATSADLVQLARSLELPIEPPIHITRLCIDKLELTNSLENMSNVVFADCYFNIVEVADSITPDFCPTFSGCYIQEIEGRVSDQDLPIGKFPDTIVGSYLSTAVTTNAALQLNIPMSAKVLLTVLKKLFVQSLSGRKESALYRGLDSTHQAKVPGVLSLIRSHSLVTVSDRPGDPIWVPVRRMRSRVLSMIASPSLSNDPVLVEARTLK